MVIFFIFCYFFGILYYRSGKNSSERFFLFFVFLSLPHHILAWKEAIIVFSKFLNFFTIFLKFSITGQERTRWNDFFSLFLSLSQLILAWREAILVFFNFFELFCYFFGIFYYRSDRNSSERFFFFSLSRPSPTYSGSKRTHNSVFYFFEVFYYFFGIFYYGSSRNSSKRFFLFFIYFTSFSAFPNLFWLK